MPKKTIDVQVTTMDAVLEFSIEVGLAHLLTQLPWCFLSGFHSE